MKRKNFSLVEVMIALVIGSMVILVVMSFFKKQSQDIHEGNLRNVTSHEATLIMGYIEKDLKSVKMNRNKPENTIIKNQNDSNISILFEKYSGKDQKVCYAFNGETGYFIRSVDNKAQILGKHISEFAVTPNKEKTGLNIIIVSSIEAPNTHKNIETKSETTVFLRENYFYSLDKNWNKNDDIHGLFNIKGDLTFKKDIKDIAQGIKDLPKNEAGKIQKQFDNISNNLQNFDSLFAGGVSSLASSGSSSSNSDNSSSSSSTSDNSSSNSNNSSSNSNDSSDSTNQASSIQTKIDDLNDKLKDAESKEKEYSDQLTAYQDKMQALSDKASSIDSDDEDALKEFEAESKALEKEYKDLTKKLENASNEKDKLNDQINDLQTQLDDL